MQRKYISGILKKLIYSKRAMSPGIPVGAIAEEAKIASIARKPVTPAPTYPQEEDNQSNSEVDEIKKQYEQRRAEQMESANKAQAKIDQKSQAAQALGVIPHPVAMVASVGAGQEVEKEQKELNEKKEREQREILKKLEEQRASTGNAGFGNKVMSGQAGTGSENLMQHPPWFSVILGLILIATGIKLYNDGGQSAYLALSGIVAALSFLIAVIATRGSRNIWYTKFFIFALLGVTIYLMAFYTVPYTYGSIMSGNEDQSLVDRGVEGAKTANTGLAKTYEDLLKSFNQQMAAAKGENLQGDVSTQIVPETIFTIKDCMFKNPAKPIEYEEKDSTEICHKIKGFDSKSELTVSNKCYMQTQEESHNWSVAYTNGKIVGPKKNLGQDKTVEPTDITGFTFEQEVSCTPIPEKSGKYVVTMNFEAANLRTDAQMPKYIIDKDTLDKKIRNYFESQGTDQVAQSQYDSAINSIYGAEITNPKSISQKGPIKTIMTISQASTSSLIGMKQGKPLTFKFAIENEADGWITKVNKLEITIPPDFKTDCKFWKIVGNKLVLTEEYLKNASFDNVPKMSQKVLPSCQLSTTLSAESLAEPKEALFLALVEYNYLLQKEINIEVKNVTQAQNP